MCEYSNSAANSTQCQSVTVRFSELLVLGLHLVEPKAWLDSLVVLWHAGWYTQAGAWLIIYQRLLQ